MTQARAPQDQARERPRSRNPHTLDTSAGLKFSMWKLPPPAGRWRSTSASRSLGMLSSDSVRESGGMTDFLMSRESPYGESLLFQCDGRHALLTISENARNFQP